MANDWQVSVAPCREEERDRLACLLQLHCWSSCDQAIVKQLAVCANALKTCIPRSWVTLLVTRIALHKSGLKELGDRAFVDRSVALMMHVGGSARKLVTAGTLIDSFETSTAMFIDIEIGVQRRVLDNPFESCNDRPGARN